MREKNAVSLFLMITLALSAVCFFVRIWGGDEMTVMTSVLMWCPGIAAFITQGVYYPGQKILGIHFCSFRYVLLGLLTPVLYLGVSYGIFWMVFRETMTGKMPYDSAWMYILPGLLSVLTAAGEEIGWRGFLLPKLEELWNLKMAVVVSGLIWAAWHFPLIVTGLYRSGIPAWYQIPLFTVEILAMTLILAVLRTRSCSILPVVFFHASHNFLDRMIFSSLTAGDMKPYFVGDTGWMTAVVLILAAACIALTAGWFMDLRIVNPVRVIRKRIGDKRINAEKEAAEAWKD